MTNPFNRRPSLFSRVSHVDGSFHPNQAMRDAHDAMARSRRAQDMAQQSREIMEKNRNRAQKARQSFSLYPSRKSGGGGVVGSLLFLVVAGLQVWLCMHK